MPRRSKRVRGRSSHRGAGPSYTVSSSGSVEYAADFQQRGDAMYIYFRPRSVAGIAFRTLMIESALAQIAAYSTFAVGFVARPVGGVIFGHFGDIVGRKRALVAAVEAMPAKRRSVVVSAAGDRRDQDIREQTVILGAAFDDVLLYQDAAQRGRADGEVMALLREGLEGASRTTHIEEIRGEFAAIDAALARLAPGDLCLVLVDQVEEALAHLARRVAGG